MVPARNERKRKGEREMPVAPHTICTHQGCAELVPSGSRCSHHSRRVDARPSAYRRGYGSSRWLRLRKMVLSRDPICVCCELAEATVADHILPKKMGGPDSLANLQALCKGCHAAKTLQEGR